MSEQYAIVLAAGFSTRMGSCKAALPWQDGHTLLSYQTSTFLDAGIVPIIVLGTHNHHLDRHCAAPVLVVINPDASRGKISSIRAGLEALPESFETVTISAVDQPRSVAVYRRLLQEYRIDRPPIVAPIYRERIGHPLLFCRSMLSHLQNLEEATQGLRAIVEGFHPSIRFIEWDSPEILDDLNFPDSYRRAIDSRSKEHPP